VQLVAGEDFVGRLKAAVEANNHATPDCLSVLRVGCEIAVHTAWSLGRGDQGEEDHRCAV
jgi:hypothetical protein